MALWTVGPWDSAWAHLQASSSPTLPAPQFKLIIAQVLLLDFCLALLADRVLQFFLGTPKLKVPS